MSAVNIALPDLARDLRIGPAEIGWTITTSPEEERTTWHT
jgi:hypothetical protein